MAVTKELTTAIPSLSGGKVVEWEVGMTYTNGVSGDAQYYVSEFTNGVMSNDDTYGFGLSAESAWNTQAQLLALCPIAMWDAVFASQVESVFNPPVQPVPDNSYVIPTKE
jgi:hypothetical protein